MSNAWDEDWPADMAEAVGRLVRGEGPNEEDLARPNVQRALIGGAACLTTRGTQRGADLMKVSRNNVERCRATLKRAEPGLIARLWADGEMTVWAAFRIARLPREEQAELLSRLDRGVRLKSVLPPPGHAKPKGLIRDDHRTHVRGRVEPDAAILGRAQESLELIIRHGVDPVTSLDASITSDVAEALSEGFAAHISSLYRINSLLKKRIKNVGWRSA